MAEQAMTLPVQTMTGSESDKYRELAERVSSELRVAAPGIIQSYDSATQTATVQLAIREKVSQMDGTTKDTDLPLLLDCPVMMPRGGGFVMTYPIEAGDECLVIFADACIDGWWQSGGVQNQSEKRRHDLSDGIVLPALWSQAKKLETVEAGVRITQEGDGGAYLAITEDGFELKKGGAVITGTEDSVGALVGDIGIKISADGVTATVGSISADITASGATVTAGAVTGEVTASGATLTAGGTALAVTSGGVAVTGGTLTVDGKQVEVVE